ncbi:AfsR/SARP family transcriptional regulator [Nonomuraea cavernae]|uniref:SARP family transcriptional regulator n=1 Tax=Nonomuraea cavernae TaxID=2045107 RepID=A0A917YYZ8_9ACTN|nr:BTAD domain-containing putative transcriptional regulator [Nonomuraea cavernae]MCA2186304.1 winged helix-turn-helix domain-containing protein [Nonomuraea cavernae]GGO69592.1 SARP family transcriptional regulator [Nonomuraea cavernae]
MRFFILGPVEVATADGPASVARPRHRALLAYLLLQANQVISPDQLIEAIWGGAEPSSARSQIHVALSELRRALRKLGLDEVIATRPGGYLLALADDELDAGRFGRHVEAARDLRKRDEVEESVRRLQAALGLWRGHALADISAAYAQSARQALHEHRLNAHESLAEAELTLGHHDALLPALGKLVEQHPLRERLVCHLMLAQYRAGMQAEALLTARRLRARLVEEQGLDPSTRFSALEKAILNADPALDLAPRTITISAPPSDTTPAQLPLDTWGFTGRDRELAELDLLADVRDTPPVVLIVGTPGVGKTALAVRWAHRHGDRFPDGQLYVNMRGFDQDRPPLDSFAILRRFLSSLGVDPGATPEDVDEAAALFRSLLARRRVLIVLDNARSADQVRPLLPGSATCAVLVTSRNRLRGLVAHEGARLLQLGPLTEDEASDLLRVALAGRSDALAGGRDALAGGSDALAGGSDEDGDAAARQVALRCAYLPLALRLAAAQLTGQRHLTLADYARQLTTGDTLAVLDEHGDLDGAVSTAFRLSYQALPPATQRLFRLLSLLPGQDFAPVAAAALLGVSLATIRPRLEELCIGHLVSEHRPGRYAMHDLLRSYAVRTLESEEPEADRTTAARRLVDFYAETVFEAYPLLQPRRLAGDREVVYPPREPLRFADRASALDWHDQELENLVGVVALANAHAWHRRAWQLAADLLAYFIIRRRWPEWLSVLRTGLLSAERSGQPEGRAHMENALGVVHKQIGRYAAAREHYGRAIELAARAGNMRMVAAFNANLGGLAINEGDLEGGLRHLRTALSIPEYGQVPQYAVAAYINLGCALIDMERYPAAADALQRALMFADVADDTQQACYSHHNLAEIALRQGDPVTARRHAERQLRLAEEIGDPLRRASAHDSLASALVHEDQATARTHWLEARRIYRELDHQIAAVLDEWLAALDTFSDAAELAAADEARRRRCRHLI